MRPNRFIPKEKAEKMVTRKRRRIQLLNQYYRFLEKGGGWLNLLEKNLVFAAFLTLMGIVYIWNTHKAEKHARNADLLAREVRELESEYNTLNALLAKSRKQSAIIEMSDSIGLRTPSVPPIKLEIAP